MTQKFVVENRLAELADYIATGESGMQTFDQHIVKLYLQKVISGTEALRQATNPVRGFHGHERHFDSRREVVPGSRAGLSPPVTHHPQIGWRASIHTHIKNMHTKPDEWRSAMSSRPSSRKCLATGADSEVVSFHLILRVRQVSS